MRFSAGLFEAFTPGVYVTMGDATLVLRTFDVLEPQKGDIIKEFQVRTHKNRFKQPMLGTGNDAFSCCLDHRRSFACGFAYRSSYDWKFQSAAASRSHRQGPSSMRCHSKSSRRRGACGGPWCSMALRPLGPGKLQHQRDLLLNRS